MQASAPRELPHRGELLAAVAVLIVLAHLLFAQLTAVVALCCHVTSRVTNWRQTWLAAPTAVGIVWTLAVGPRPAAAGVLAAPAHALAYITSSSGPPGHLLRVAGLFAGAGHWIPSQLPLALLTGAAEAVVLARIRPMSQPGRPGPWEFARRTVNAWRLRRGGLRVRDGVALGIDAATGSPVPLAWESIAGGVLITGAAETNLTRPAFHVVEMAIRRRMPVVVVDLSHHAAIMTRLRDACARWECPVEVATQASSVALGSVVRDRAAALFPMAGQVAAARLVCEDLLATARRLRHIGAPGDGVVWLRCCGELPPELVTAVMSEGAIAGLAVVATMADPVAAAGLADRAAVAIRLTRPGELEVRIRGAVPVRAVMP